MPISQTKVCDGWIQLLGRYSWDWFVTMTFRGDYTHPESADKRWRLWVSMVNRQLYGPRWYKKKQSVDWIRALELQQRGVIHYHALMSHPHNLNSLLLRFSEMDNINTIAGYARIYPPRSIEAVSKYCAKYVVKGGEIECSPFLQQRQMDSVGSAPKPLTRVQTERLKLAHIARGKDRSCHVTPEQADLIESQDQRIRDMEAVTELFS